MKKLIAATLTFATIIVLAAADAPTAGADGSCGSCCDLDPHGEAQVRCALTRLVPCGDRCACPGIAGHGFGC